MASNIKNFKCLIHFNETQRGSILSEYLTYSKLHEMVMQKFNLEANAVIKLSFKLSSFDSVVDITDDAEVQFFVECACNSDDEFAHLFVSERKNNQKNMFFNFFKSTTLENEGPSNQEIPSSFLNNGISFDLGQNDFHSNDSLHLQNEPHFSNPESSFDFRSNEYNTDDVVNENPQNKIHKWQKFMSFEPDIPETPVYKAKPNISKQYTQQSEVEKGKIFDNKESLILAVRLKALSEGFQFLTDRSAPERCYLKCYHFNECDWYLRANMWDHTEKYYITYLNDVHTCSKTQTYPNHRNANKKVIGHLLTPKLQDRSRVLRGKDIQQDILSEYKIHISYQQAMKGKHYGTVTRIKTDDNGVFEMLFIAIGASIRTFLNYLRPVLMIDAAHLKGLYKGTNLVAVAMDGNNQIVPIAFGICKGETSPCWAGESVLKECIGDNPNLLFISDRHAAIALAVEKEFPLAFHAVCCRHLMMNLGLKNKKRKGLFWKICKAYTREDLINKHEHPTKYVQPDAHEKLCRAGPQRWSRAHCPLVRYNYMTSNSVESVNACSVIYRKEPVLKLAETYRAMVQEWYYKRRQLADLAKVCWKLQIFVAHTPIDLSTVLIPNDGSFEQSLAGVISEATKIKLEESLKYLHQMQKRKNKKFDYYGLWGELAQYKLEIYIDHIGVNFVIHKYIFPNASLAEMMNHVITDYSSENEGIIRQETQNDYTSDQMVEWAEQEHIEYEETKVSCPKIDQSSMLIHNNRSKEESFGALPVASPEES
ncbi:transposase, MuDR, MULE transposase domain protein [Tanacetum coccineum]